MIVKSTFLLILFAVLLVACAVTPEPLTDTELTQQAEEDEDRLFNDAEPLSDTDVLTLPVAIARALKYNLDHRVQMMGEALALDQFDVDKFDLLPNIVAATQYHSRSKYSDIQRSSEDSYSHSSEKDTTTGEFTSSWNILDFGISYYTAKQSADRTLIATERRRKVLHSLTQEVFFAYWRVVAYQQLKERINEAVRLAERELANTQAEIEEQLSDPLQALRYQKMLLENIAKLDQVERELSSAHITLATLVSVKPGTQIRVATPELGDLVPPEWDVPMVRMEEIAFLNNPDIREKTYQYRIAIKETRKAIISMLPGISLISGYRYDSNEYLRNNHWHEWSARLTWNILDMLRAPVNIEHAETREELVEMQRLALRMAVLGQVHLADHEFRVALKQFERADRFFHVSRQISGLVETGRIGSASVRDSVYEKTGEIVAQLQRYQSYAELQAVYSQLHATLGLSIAPPSLISADLDHISSAVESRLLAWQRGDLVRRAVAQIANDSPATDDMWQVANSVDIAPVSAVSASLFMGDINQCDWQCARSEEHYFASALHKNDRNQSPFKLVRLLRTVESDAKGAVAQRPEPPPVRVPRARPKSLRIFTLATVHSPQSGTVLVDP